MSETKPKRREWRTTTEAKRDEVRAELAKKLPPPQGRTIEDGQKQILDGVGNGGAKCPCCGNPATVARQSLSSTQVRMLCTLLEDHQRTGREWLDLSKSTKADKQKKRGDVPKMKHWGLIQQNDEGHVRVTELARAWLAGNQTVPRYAFIYSKTALAHDDARVRVADVDKTFTEQGGVPAVMDWRAKDDKE